MSNSFYSPAELADMNFASLGNNVKISRKASFYSTSTIHIGDNSRIDDFCVISGNISIGAFVHVAAICAIYAQRELCTLSDFSGLAPRATLFTFSEDYLFGTSLTNPTVPERYKTRVDEGAIRLGKHAIVGTGSYVSPGSVFGQGAVLAALSLGRGELRPWTVYRGNPSEVVARRRSHRVLELEEQFRTDLAAGAVSS